AVSDEVTPAADRQRMQAFMYLAAVIHEILEFRDKTVSTWSGLSAYRSVFTVVDESLVSAQASDMLHKIRNRAAFHFQADLIEKTMPTLPNEPFVMLSGHGTGRMSANYDLADLLTFGFLFGSMTDAPVAFERYQEFSAVLRPLVANFIQVADRVIFSRLIDRGCRIAERPDGTYRS